MIRWLVMLSMMFLMTFFLKVQGYGERWIWDLFVLLGLSGLIFLLEFALARYFKAYLLSFLLGPALGIFFFNAIIVPLNSISFVAALFDLSSYQLFFKLICIYFGMTLLCFYTQEHFCVKTFSCPLNLKESPSFQKLKWFLRLFFVFLFILSIFSFFQTQLHVGQDTSDWLTDMAHQGYDFNLKVQRTWNKSSMILIGFIFLFGIAELLWSRFLIRNALILFSVTNFMMIMANVFISLFHGLNNDLSSDFLQAWIFMLCAYWSFFMGRSVVKMKTFRLPFINIELI